MSRASRSGYPAEEARRSGAFGSVVEPRAGSASGRGTPREPDEMCDDIADGPTWAGRHRDLCARGMSSEQVGDPLAGAPVDVEEVIQGASVTRPAAPAISRRSRWPGSMRTASPGPRDR